MRQFEVIPPAQDIVHPTCAKCGAPMWLTRIDPDGPSLEKRTFECQACQNEAIDVVRKDRQCSDNGFKSRLALRLIKVKVLVDGTK